MGKDLWIATGSTFTYRVLYPGRKGTKTQNHYEPLQPIFFFIWSARLAALGTHYCRTSVCWFFFVCLFSQNSWITKNRKTKYFLQWLHFLPCSLAGPRCSSRFVCWNRKPCWCAPHRQAPSYSQVIREAVGHIGPSELVLIQLPGNPVAVEPYQCGLQFRPTTWEDIQS